MDSFAVDNLIAIFVVGAMLECLLEFVHMVRDLKGPELIDVDRDLDGDDDESSESSEWNEGQWKSYRVEQKELMRSNPARDHILKSMGVPKHVLEGKNKSVELEIGKSIELVLRYDGDSSVLYSDAIVTDWQLKHDVGNFSNPFIPSLLEHEVTVNFKCIGKVQDE